MDRKGKHEVKEIPAGRPQCHPWILFAWAPNLALFVAQLAGECSFVHPSLPQVLSLPASPLVPASVLHSTVLIASERMPASATGNFAPSQALDPSPPPGTQPLYGVLPFGSHRHLPDAGEKPGTLSTATHETPRAVSYPYLPMQPGFLFPGSTPRPRRRIQSFVSRPHPDWRSTSSPLSLHRGP